MSTASTETDPGGCSEEGLTEVSANRRASFGAAIPDISQEEYSRAVAYAITDDSVRYEGAFDKDCHLNEACTKHANMQEDQSQALLGPGRADESELRRLPEPRRASRWLRMCFVACNGNYIRFEAFYKCYCEWFEPMVTEDFPEIPTTPFKSPTSQERRQAEPERRPRDQRPEKDDTQERPSSKEHTETTEADQHPKRKRPPAAPYLTRPEFLRVLSNVFHGMRVYHPGGRIHSWSSDVIQCQACSKYVLSGICCRKELLSFESTKRKKNLRQLRQYKEQGDIVFPEGGPAKLNTFARKLAEDPLFMLPAGTESPWREREMRRLREGSHPKKSVEEAAFPGLSLKKKVFSVPKEARKPKAGLPTQDTGLRRTPEISKPTRKPKLDADERLVAGKEEGKGKQKKDSLEPQMVDLARSTKLTDDLSDAIRPTALRRRSAPTISVNIPPSSSGQSTTPGINDIGLGAVAVNAGNVREFAELVRRHNSDVIAANSAAMPEELAGEFEKLGIKADLPRWKKERKQ